MKKILFLGLSLALLTGCQTLKDFAKAMTLGKCEFRMVSVSDTSVAGISIQGKTSLKDISPFTLLKLQGVLAGGSLPLSFILNLEGKNPNDSPAGLGHFAWILDMDGNELTTGTMDKSFEIPANGGTTPIPLAVTLDLRKVLSGKNLDSMLNLALNVAGEGTKPTHLTLKLKPSVQVAGQDLDYPGYITLTQEFGGK